MADPSKGVPHAGAQKDSVCRHDLQSEAQRCADHVRLALGRRDLRGTLGNWSGSGTGSSIEFQDHRPYLPGDDPRHIDWAATARSDQAVMKVYREEVSPRMDLILDTSASMGVTSEKHVQTLNLFLFCLESAGRLTASVQVWMLEGNGLRPVQAASILDGGQALPELKGHADRPDLSCAGFRSGSLRILVSDLLFAGDPAPVLRPLCAQKGRVMLLCPFDRSESAPDWTGNLLLEDCESGTLRHQRLTPHLLEKYRTAYRNHMGMWKEQALKLGIGLARVPAHLPLVDALQEEALPLGLVEVWA